MYNTSFTNELLPEPDTPVTTVMIDSGTPQKVMKDKKSLTGQYLSGKKRIEVPEYRRPASDRKISIR
ncbi:hypothetical protein IDG70_07325, partial [Staphylococcus sp. EG-SA-26]|nr:hypothetical protein [Staphylococcus sp. EG-SA-26]